MYTKSRFIGLFLFDIIKVMKIKALPFWLISGVMIFPVLIVLGLLFGLCSEGRINTLFWLVIPSIIFEETFEICCQTFSDSMIFNLLFIGIFWFGIGSLTGWLTEKSRNILNF
jgi:hypothetical protein